MNVLSPPPKTMFSAETNASTGLRPPRPPPDGTGLHGIDGGDPSQVFGRGTGGDTGPAGTLQDRNHIADIDPVKSGTREESIDTKAGTMHLYIDKFDVADAAEMTDVWDFQLFRLC
ncbi:hypothetical protein [Streptosporangium sp. NPDC001681]|uniref:hypothetical protein n=1 Tax=Streptosporangium sp. NPDC001681 TaxID=3154395 RepID=UPI00332CFAF7